MSNEKEIEKFDPSKLMDGVKDRIKATFVSLIPDDQWEVMCNTEMQKFFTPIKSQYGNGTEPSEFQKLATELMREHCREYLKAMFAKPEYAVEKVYGTSQNPSATETIKLSDHLDKMIKEKMPEMMAAMFAQIMSTSFYQLFNQVQHQLNTQR